MFISETFVRQHVLATCKKQDGGYNLKAVDGSDLPSVDSETMPLSLVFQKHCEMVTLDIVPMARHDVVLGTPWLERHNPNIDWKVRVLRFERCSCVTDIDPRSRQRSTLDEERNICDTDAQPTTKRQSHRSNSTDAGATQPDQQVRADRGSHAPLDIPVEFRKWIKLFQEEDGLAALPRQTPTMGSQNQASTRKGATIWTAVRAVRKGTGRATKGVETERGQRMDPPFTIIRGLTSDVRSKEGGWYTNGHRLSRTQSHNG